MLYYYKSCGRKQETMSTIIPTISTEMVLREHPFHSWRIMPHTLEKVTLSAMRMQNDKVMSVGEEVRKPFPSDSPKN